ncbi:putative T7SS-secreted protein [Streptomyces sp. NPDC001415]
MGLLDDIGDGLSQVGDGINKGLGAVEDGIDAGKKELGKGIDWATGKVGEGLDHVGLHNAANVVESLGDQLASDLGATPGERQLGQTDLPNELVHGNDTKIRASAKHLRDFFTAFDHVGQGMKGLDSSHWHGNGADSFRKKFEMHPVKWAHAADACEKAAGALERYADTIKWAQGQAQDAIELYKKGKNASDSAVKAYNQRVDAYNTKLKADQDPGPRPEPFQDPGTTDLKKAAETLADARRQRNEAGRTAATAVKSALAHAPAKPPPLNRLGADITDGYQAANTELTHVAGGVIKGAAGLANFARGLNPTDPYNLTHPAAYAQNVSMTLSGLVSTATHPERVVQATVDGFMKDPSEFVGRLIPELIGTKGAGLARGGLRLGLKDGLEAGVENGAGKAARDAVGERPNAHARQPDAVETKGSDPVDMATGKMFLPQTDVVLPGTLPLVFTRRVESGYHLGRWFGPSWSSTVDQRLEIDSEGVVFVTEDGLLLAYPHPATGVPTLPSHGPQWPLDREDGGYTVNAPESGRTWHFTNVTGELAVLQQIDDRNGNWITFEYDDEGTPLAMTAGDGRGLSFTTHEGRITGLQLSSTRTQLLEYGYAEATGNVSTVINSSGLPLRFTYDERGRVTSWTDTNDRSYTYAYDDQDRCVREGGAEGHMALSLSYTGPDPITGMRTTTTVTGEGATRHFLINGDWQVVTETDPLGAVTRYERDTRNRLLARIDPLGHRTSFEYDEVGNPVRAVRPDGRETRADYSSFGLPVKIKAFDGTALRHTYDERGNRTSTTTSTGATTHYAYNAAGHLTSVTDPLGQRTTVVCDGAGLLVAVTNPLGAATRYERDPFGRPTAVTDPLGATTRLEWTIEGKLARRILPDGTSESWTYDGEGNCTTHIDTMGGITRSEYSHFDVLTARTGPDGVRYEFTHDAELRLIRVHNPQGLTWDYVYDLAGRLIRESDFDDRPLTYAYDPAGRLTTRTDALSRTIAFDHDPLGRVVRKDAHGTVTTYTYDFTDRLAHAEGPGTSVVLLRDRHGRLRSETVDGRTTTYTYDMLGRRTGRTTPTGAVSTWSYDAAGNRVRLTASGRAVTFDHDTAGRETNRRIADTLTLTSTYDALGRLLAQGATTTAGEKVSHRAYRYRPDGNLTGIDDHLRGTRTFDLDQVGRVTAVHADGWSERYAYDAAGNQTEAHWPEQHPGGRDATGPRAYEGTRITRAGSIRYEHDALGRIVLRQKTRLSRKPDTWRYEWGPEDRLTAVSTPDGTRWRYTYDPMGRRTAKLRLAADGSDTVIERVEFSWDGTTLCEQTSTGGGLPRPVTLTWDHLGLRPLAQTERILDASQEEIDSRFFSIITDLVGAPSELVDEQGDIVWHTRATLWGTTTWAADSTAYTPLRFPGQYYDPETGLHHNHFRIYDPETARYLTPDPLGLAPAPNASTYVTNPHTWADPLGLAPDYHEFHTVQDSPNATRLRGDGTPWPTEDIRGQYGEGVYSWGSAEEAARYAERLQGRGADVEVLRFKISADDFSSLNRADVTKMNPAEAEAFMDRYSRLYGDGEPHDFDYIRGHTGMGDEHYFTKDIFHLLKFHD